MAAGKLHLPGDFKPGKSYTLKGETLLAWQKNLVADRVVAGPGLSESGAGPNGRILSAKSALPKRQFDIFDFFPVAGIWYLKVRRGYVLVVNPAPQDGEAVMDYIEVTGTVLDDDEDVKHLVGPNSKVFVKVTTNRRDITQPDGAEIVVSTADMESIHAQPDPAGEDGVYYYRIAEIKEDPAGSNALSLKIQYHVGGPITHRPARNKRNLKIIIEQRKIESGVIVSAGEDQFVFYRQGLYVGVTDPGDGLSEEVRYFTRMVAS